MVNFKHFSSSFCVVLKHQTQTESNNMYYNLNLTQRERERERERERTAKKVQNRIPNNRGRINDDQQKYEVELCVKSSNLCLYIYVTLFMHAFYNSVQRKLHGQKRKEARKLEKNNNNNQKVYRAKSACFNILCMLGLNFYSSNFF